MAFCSILTASVICKSANYEVRPVFQWNKDNHVTTLAFDYRHIERTPDSYGIVYFNPNVPGANQLAGTPLSVPDTSKYSTPFSYGNQDMARATLTDAWWFADYLTINNHLAFTYRDVSHPAKLRRRTISFIGGTWQQLGATIARANRSRQRLHLPIRAGLEIPHRHGLSHAADRRAGRMAEHRR